jgi:hypothetical protein
MRQKLAAELGSNEADGRHEDQRTNGHGLAAGCLRFM